MASSERIRALLETYARATDEFLVREPELTVMEMLAVLEELREALTEALLRGRGL